MSLLAATDVRKSFGGIAALSGVDLAVEAGEVHALLGGNGSGKSTFIKAIAGVQQADSGRVALAGAEFALDAWTAADAHDNGLRFVHQSMATFLSASVAENLCAGKGWERRGPQIEWRRVRAKARDVLDQLEIDVDVDRTMRDLSPAQRSVVSVARAFMDVPAGGRAVLVLDEPSASLHDKEMHVLRNLVRKLASQDHGVVYVSHRMDEIMDIADRVTVYRDGHNVGTVPVAETSRTELIEMILGRSTPAGRSPSHEAGGRAVLDATDVRTATLRGVSCRVAEGEIVGLAGLADAGCSELLQAIHGSIPASGQVVLGGSTTVDLAHHAPERSGRLGIGYVPSDRAADAVFSSLSITDNAIVGSLRHYYRGYLRHRRIVGETSRALDANGVRRASDDLRITALSGGNQQKVVLTRVLRQRPRVLLLEDPTQGVDAGAKEEVWAVVRRLAEEGACVLMHSTDYEELVAVADRVVVLSYGEEVGTISGKGLTRRRLTEMTYESRGEVA